MSELQPFGAPAKPAVILCADWGKSAAKRAVYKADVRARCVEQVPHWGSTAMDLLAYAQATADACGGPVLVGFDVPLGVPGSYLSAFSGVFDTEFRFIDLLQRARTLPRFYTETSDPNDWRLEQPFFTVPAGTGGLRSYLDATAMIGVRLERRIDRQTGAKSLFIKSGIPGSVGSAACSLWQELGAALDTDRPFRLWPFEGTLEHLLTTTRVVIGEMYPRAAYATAISDERPEGRARLSVAKTDVNVRRAFIERLRSAHWVRWSKVTLTRLDEAEASEDDFDACVTAAALLRCVLEDVPLAPASIEDPDGEGAMLGTGSISLTLPQRQFTLVSADRPDRLRLTSVSKVSSEQGKASLPSMNSLPHPARASVRQYPCPIPGCEKVFHNSRGGWDGHVGSLSIHPAWYPTIHDPEERRHCFKRDFPAFFV